MANRQHVHVEIRSCQTGQGKRPPNNQFYHPIRQLQWKAHLLATTGNGNILAVKSLHTFYKIYRSNTTEIYPAVIGIIPIIQIKGLVTVQGPFAKIIIYTLV